MVCPLAREGTRTLMPSTLNRPPQRPVARPPASPPRCIPLRPCCRADLYVDGDVGEDGDELVVGGPTPPLPLPAGPPSGPSAAAPLLPAALLHGPPAAAASHPQPDNVHGHGHASLFLHPASSAPVAASAAAAGSDGSSSSYGGARRSSSASTAAGGGFGLSDDGDDSLLAGLGQYDIPPMTSPPKFDFSVLDG